MSNLTACQPGWVAVFVDGNGYSTEPIACWRIDTDYEDVRPICAMGGDVCDATKAKNYIGVIGPGGDPKKLYEAHCTSLKKTA